MSLLPNDFDMALETIVEIYRKRWLIESLFTQIKQNFPLRYFYGESANAIKIQVCATLIGNLLMTLLQRRLTQPWSFSGLATMVRIVLMYYINMDTFFERPDEDLKLLLKQTSEEPLEEENLT
ncbi:DDE family transposase [Bacteroides heparinolyticus]|uniref:DDE family transposase n=2 Tax=Prevotella heparinolytica TaxID=28113 RepID=A0A4R2LPW0_9BACE|nr:DDE family transposase [Bacteroides heparinolyticus]